MGADEFDVNGPEAIGDRYNEPVIVSLDIENHTPILEDAGTSVLRLDVCWLRPVRSLDFAPSSLEMLLGIRKLPPILPKNSGSNDPHRNNIVPYWDTANQIATLQIKMEGAKLDQLTEISIEDLLGRYRCRRFGARAVSHGASSLRFICRQISVKEYPYIHWETITTL